MRAGGAILLVAAILAAGLAIDPALGSWGPWPSPAGAHRDTVRLGARFYADIELSTQQAVVPIRIGGEGAFSALLNISTDQVETRVQLGLSPLPTGWTTDLTSKEVILGAYDPPMPVFFKVTVPENATVGESVTFYLNATSITDAASLPFQVTLLPAVDLVVASFEATTVYPQVIEGEVVKVRATVANEGTVNASGVFCHIGAGASVIGLAGPFDLPRGTSTEVILNWTSTGSGEVEFYAEADPGDVIPEVNETNNRQELTLAIHDEDEPVMDLWVATDTAYTFQKILFHRNNTYAPRDDLNNNHVVDGAETDSLNYTWEMGDGSILYGPVVQHAYADDGVYNVTLTARDMLGGSGVRTTTVTVLNRPPEPRVTHNATKRNVVLTFNASGSTDRDGEIVSFDWTFFGDDGEPSFLTGPVVQWTYGMTGEQRVLLNLTDDDGAWNQTILAFEVAESYKPVPMIRLSPAAEVATLDWVELDGYGSADPDGRVIGWSWDLGDGNRSAEPVLRHNYTRPGLYRVTLTVRDDEGLTASTSVTITALNRAPTVSITTNTSGPYVPSGTALRFEADADDPDGAITAYEWEFGDGDTGTGPVIDHVYARPGVYVVALTVTDSSGATNRTLRSITVLNRPPVAVLAPLVRPAVLSYETIQIDLSASYDPDGRIAIYTARVLDPEGDVISLVDGAGPLLSVNLTLKGDLVIEGIVTDDRGATSPPARAAITVLNRAPTARASGPGSGVAGTPLRFDGSASTDPDSWGMLSYEWSFGDGSTATGRWAQHAFGSEGEYTVVLRVRDETNASDSTTIRVSIRSAVTEAPRDRGASEVEKSGISWVVFFLGLGAEAVAALVLLPVALLLGRRRGEREAEAMNLRAAEAAMTQGRKPYADGGYPFAREGTRYIPPGPPDEPGGVDPPFRR